MRPLADDVQKQTDAMHVYAQFLAQVGAWGGAADIWRQEYEVLLHAQPEGSRHHKGRPAHNVGFARIRGGAADQGLRWTLIAFVEDALTAAEEGGTRWDLTAPAAETLRLYELPEEEIQALAGRVRARFEAGEQDGDPNLVWDLLGLGALFDRFRPSSRAAAAWPIRVFVSSPSDVRPLRLVVVDVCAVLTNIHSRHVEPLLWEGGSPERPHVPSFPPRIAAAGPQAVIDDHVWNELGGYDIYLGIQGDRLGTATGAYRSGTEAELRYALNRQHRDGRPSVLFYEVRGGTPDPGVADFIHDLHALGVVAKVFDPTTAWMDLLTHLSQELRRVPR
jgi:hypothetical protein